MDASRWEGAEEEGVGTREAAVGGRVEEEVLEEEGSVSGLLAVTGPVACIRHKSIFYYIYEQMYIHVHVHQQTHKCHTIYILVKYSNGSSDLHSAIFFCVFRGSTSNLETFRTIMDIRCDIYGICENCFHKI